MPRSCAGRTWNLEARGSCRRRNDGDKGSGWYEWLETWPFFPQTNTRAGFKLAPTKRRLSSYPFKSFLLHRGQNLARKPGKLLRLIW